jgi:hypothetical protein
VALRIAFMPAVVALLVMSPYALAFGATEDCEAAYARMVNRAADQDAATALRLYEDLRPQCGGDSRYLSHLVQCCVLFGT